MLAAALNVCVPAPKVSVAPVESKEPELVPPPSRARVPLCTRTEPVLLNATPGDPVVATDVVPVPADFWNVPALLIAGELPFQTTVWSFCTSNVVAAAMFNAPPSIVMLPVPVHVAPKLLFTV